MRSAILVLFFVSAWACNVEGRQADDKASAELLTGAKNGDLDLVNSALKSGADVNSKTPYGATALTYASERGHFEIAKILLEKGAAVNVKDTFYGATPLTWATSNNHDGITALLIDYKAEGGDSALVSAITRRKKELAEKILDSGNVSDKGILKARAAARSAGMDELAKRLNQFDVKEEPAAETQPVTLDEKKRIAGKYKSPALELEILVKDEKVFAKIEDQQFEITPINATQYQFNTSEIRFKLSDGKPGSIEWKAAGNTTKFTWVDPKSEVANDATESVDSDVAVEFAPSSAESRAADLAISSRNWPSFRGNGARGVADGQHPPIEWSIAKGDNSSGNVLWKIPVAGLANSCPAIWDDKLFLTSAVGEDRAGLKIGNYGDVKSVENEGQQSFVVNCYDKRTGKLIWKRTAKKSEVLVKRHLKSTHANCTPATDGKYVVAFFGYGGLYCYTVDGDLVWKKDLGKLDSGWFYDEGYQWGFGSSPIIFDGKVIVQCDVQKNSFIASYDLATGNQAWRVDRDEIPSWSTPTIHETDRGPMLITCGTKFARAYNALDGQEIWRLAGHSEIVVPTPFVAHGLIFITSGYRPIQPVYAIKLSAQGDISLEKEQDSNQYVQWAVKRYGPYMPSAICYGDYLYTCANKGILACYHATTGRQVYRERLSTGGKSYVGSPVAADGHIYLTAEDGQTVVVKAGPKLEVVGTNDVGENVLSTAAISEGVLYIRGQRHLFALGKKTK